jgi:hypothetical protein
MIAWFQAGSRLVPGFSSGRRIRNLYGSIISE